MNFMRESHYKIETKSLCEVCGDKARGCNFDAITCASCKEFFRRNAFKHKGLKCYFQDNCTIDVVSRRFCASCRLRKCFNAGMKKEYIMSEEQRHARKVKIIEKKQSRGPKLNGTAEAVSSGHSIASDDGSAPSSPFIATRGVNSPDLPIGAINPDAMFGFNEKPYNSAKNTNKESVFRTDCGQSDGNDKKMRDISEQIMSSSVTDVDAITKLLSKVKIIRESNYYPTKYRLLCRAKNTGKELTPKEKYKLKHLTSNVQLMQAETIHELPCSGRFVDVIKITEVITYMLIKMCKKLSAFQGLSQSDQIALVKGGCMETLLLRSIMTINLEKECWESMDLERNCKFSLKLEVLKQFDHKIYEAHRKYALSFDPEWRFDDNIMSILIAIAIFSPERPNLTDIDIIRTEQQCYLNLLNQYLQTIYDESVADRTFYKLMDQLKLTNSISEIHGKSYFDLNTSQIGETGIARLLMEIFDLNPKTHERIQ